MATAAPVYEDRDVSIGRIFQRAFSTIGHNPGVVLGLALILGALPGLIFNYLASVAGILDRIDPTNPASFRTMWTTIVISSLIGFVISAIVQGSLTRATVAENEGHKASFAECLATGFRVFLPLIGVGIVYAICTMVGFVLLFVPGIIVMLALSVASPALVVERDGVFGAIKRSRELTKGFRWKILGLYLVIGISYLLLTWLLGTFGLKQYNPAEAGNTLTIGSVLSSIVLGTMINVLAGTVQPSLYLELRQAKEGSSVQSLEEVFA